MRFLTVRTSHFSITLPANIDKADFVVVGAALSCLELEYLCTLVQELPCIEDVSVATVVFITLTEHSRVQ